MVDRLTAKDIDKFYAELLKSGSSETVVMHCHRIISAALRQAVKWDMVPASVASKASPPRVPSRAMTVPPPERVKQLIDAAAESRNPEFSIFVTLATLTGLRRGELCGLEWRDIDWEGSALTVRQALWQIAKEWGTKDPKTHQVRRLVLGPHAMEVLRFKWERVTTNAKAAEVDLVDDAFVFSTSIRGDRPLMPDNATGAFRALCKSLEERHPDPPWPYRLHDLRHYAGTEMIRHGVSPRTAADRLGHADPSLTLRVYTHDTDDQAVAAAEVLEAGIAG